VIKNISYNSGDKVLEILDNFTCQTIMIDETTICIDSDEGEKTVVPTITMRKLIKIYDLLNNI